MVSSWLIMMGERFISVPRFKTISHLTLFRMGFSGAAHGWGGKAASTPYNLSHISYNDETWQLHLTQRKSKNYMNHVTNPLSSADISIFLPEISRFCYIKKYRYRFHLDT